MADSSLRNKELDIEIRKWENEDLEIRVWMIRVGKDFYFFAKELATQLGYADPTKTIQNRIIIPEEKPTMREILGYDYRRILKQVLTNSLDLDKISRSEFLHKIHHDQRLLTEFALYSFCGGSKKEKARPFQKWVFNTIKTIRVTGSYTLPGGPVENPMDLVAKVSSLEKEVKNLREKGKVHTQKRAKQSFSKSIKTIRYDLRELKHRIKKIEDYIEELLEETTSSSSSSPQNDSESE